MLLSKLINNLDYFNTINNFKDLDISTIETDSRLVKKNSIFIAFDGKVHKGIEFAEKAIENCCVLIIVEKKYNYTNNNIMVLEVDDARKVAGDLLHNFYNNEFPKHIMAITGTKGKTSTAEFVRQSIEKLGFPAVSIGTLGFMSGNTTKNKKDGNLTTPELKETYRMLNKTKKELNSDYVIMETSSQGLDSGRLSGIFPEIIGFNNFTQDHLNYHGSMEEYFNCKLLLFGKNHCTPDTKIVLNADIPEFEKIYNICLKNNCKKENILSYGFNGIVKILNITTELDSQSVKISFQNKEFTLKTNLMGKFQIFNLLSAFCYIYFLNIAKNTEEIFKILGQVDSANGRMKTIARLKNNATIIIDFAHTNDSLKCLLETMNEHKEKVKSGKVILLFGLGGERDATKRPIMGKTAQELADFVIITNDNFRSEDPIIIRNGIESGMDKNKKNYINFEGTREEAIKYGISILQKDDVLILAGKGHEKFTMENGKISYFCEEEIVNDYIKEKKLI